MQIYDSQKIDIIKAMMKEFWENRSVTEDGALTMLLMVDVVAGFDGEEE
jgi:hypothetical protein